MTTNAPSTPRPARRQALGALSMLGALTLQACGGGNNAASGSKSSNALLLGLSLSSGSLSPAFASDTLVYVAAVPNATTALTVTPTASDTGATIRVNGSVVASGGSSSALPLNVGGNTVSLVVTAADGSTSRTYTVVVTRAAAAASSDASLAALALSAGSLSPSFAAGTLSYTADVANSVGSLTLTATTSSASATMTVGGVTVASGAASGALALAVGTTTISIVVTAQDGSTTRTYTVAVTRAAASVSSDATLSGLMLSAGTLTPSFASGTGSYAASVANGVASLTITPTATVAASTITVNGTAVANGSSSGAIALAVGSNSITIVVTAQDRSTTRTTTLTVTRAAATVSSDASLNALTLSSGSLSPAFAAATTSYTASLANTVTSVTVTPTTASSAATVKVNGSTVASGSASASVALSAGSTSTISIVVTAEDGVTTRTYTLLATRASVGTCTLTPTETQGPYPLLAILSNTAMVRSDIREGKTGVPLTVKLTILDLSNGCTPVAGAAVYIWHCDKDGLYSGYSVSNNAGQAGLTYLRGIQVTDSNGLVTFTTIYPGWYAGRITHVHFQVYLNNNLSVTATATSQLAFPQATTQAVYNTSLYTKGQNNSVTSFAADNVFSDGTTYQMAGISGDATSGYTAELQVTIA